MAHFAKLSDANLVLAIHVVSDEDMQDENGVEQESVGVTFLNNLHGWPHWKQTSYNTKGGVYYTPNTNDVDPDQTKAFRKNYAEIGGKYDSTKDAFIPVKPFTSWVLDETSCQWKAPVDMPTSPNDAYGEPYARRWNETDSRWEIEDDETIGHKYWDTSTEAWVDV